MVKLLSAATDVPGVFGTVSPPPELGQLNSAPTGQAAISTVITNIINIIFVAGAIVCIFMILFAGFQWITSGGDKEAVAKARGRITYAIIGIALMALTFVILSLLGTILHIKFFQGQSGTFYEGPH